MAYRQDQLLAKMEKDGFIKTIEDFMATCNNGREALEAEFREITINFENLSELSYATLESMSSLVSTLYTSAKEPSSDFLEEPPDSIRVANLD
jgi:hypothetical protein